MPAAGPSIRSPAPRSLSRWFTRPRKWAGSWSHSSGEGEAEEGGCKLRIENCKLQIANCKLKMAGRQRRANFQFSIFNLQFSIFNRQFSIPFSPLTPHPSPLSLVGLLLLVLAPSAWSADQGTSCLPGIVLVRDDIFGPKYEWPGLARPGTSHWREGYIYHRATTQHPLERTTTPTRPGRNLYTLVAARPHGTLTRITHLTDGEVFDPEPSYDGTKILFSMRRDGE